MKFNSIEVSEKTFRKKFFGLDPEQIFDFLKRISVEMELITKEKSELKRKLGKSEISLKEYKDRDELLKNTIANATKMADRICSDSERESKLIINNAKQRAEMIVRDAKDSLKQIYQDVADLKRIRLQFENNLRALMQSHIAMLEQGKKIMPDPVIHTDRLKHHIDNVNSEESSTSISRTADNIIKDNLPPPPMRPPF